MSNGHFEDFIIEECPEENGQGNLWKAVLDALRKKDKTLVEGKTVEDLKRSYKLLRPNNDVENINLVECVRSLEDYLIVQKLTRRVKQEAVDLDRESVENDHDQGPSQEVAPRNEGVNEAGDALNDTGDGSDRRTSSRKRKQTDFYVDDKLDYNTFHKPIKCNQTVNHRRNNFITQHKPIRHSHSANASYLQEVPSTLHTSFKDMVKDEEDPDDPTGQSKERREAFVDALIEVRYRDVMLMGAQNPIRKKVCEQALQILRSQGYYVSNKEVLGTVGSLRSSTMKKLRKCGDDISKMSYFQKRILFCAGHLDDLPDEDEAPPPKSRLSLPNFNFPQNGFSGSVKKVVRIHRPPENHRRDHLNHSQNESAFDRFNVTADEEDTLGDPYLEQLKMEEIDAKLAHLDAKKRLLALQRERLSQKARR